MERCRGKLDDRLGYKAQAFRVGLKRLERLALRLQNCLKLVGVQDVQLLRARSPNRKHRVTHRRSVGSRGLGHVLHPLKFAQSVENSPL